MGKFKLDHQGVLKIGKMLRKQVANVNRELARETYDFFTNFAYKRSGGGVVEGGGGYTLYYLANWRVGINGYDTTVSPEYRLTETPQGEKITYPVDRERAIRETAYVLCDDVISVTNSVDYGKTLNDGGRFQYDYEYNGKKYNEEEECQPNRFVEKCEAYITQQAKFIIRRVEKECPTI